VKRLLGVGVLCMLLAGCVSGEGQFQWRYYQHYSAAQKNRQALANLRPGMSQEEVRTVMGEPEMVEAYPRETVWFYRTATMGVMEGSQEIDFTPLFFDERQRLKRWGRTTFPSRPLGADRMRTSP